MSALVAVCVFAGAGVCGLLALYVALARTAGAADRQWEPRVMDLGPRPEHPEFN